MENFNASIRELLNKRKYAEAVSVRTLVLMIGSFAFLLPVVLYAGHWLLSGTVEFHTSISGYYYSCLRNVFVGVLFTIGFFLFAYKGYSLIDNILASIGGLSAIGVAIFPTRASSTYEYGIEVCALCNDYYVHHYASAAVLFSILAIFCLFLFTRKSDGMYWRRSYEFWVYFTSGILIIACMLGIFLYSTNDSINEALEGAKTVFILESLALCFFGFSWGVKSFQLVTKEEQIEREKAESS